MDLLIIHRTAFLGGLLFMLIALLLSANRTGNYRGLLRFWERNMDMNATEFKLHRTGLLGMLLGVVLSLVDQLL